MRGCLLSLKSIKAGMAKLLRPGPASRGPGKGHRKRELCSLFLARRKKILWVRKRPEGGQGPKGGALPPLGPRKRGPLFLGPSFGPRKKGRAFFLGPRPFFSRPSCNGRFTAVAFDTHACAWVGDM
jgi:hypothetical protein